MRSLLGRRDSQCLHLGARCLGAGLKDVITGETLCDEKAPVILERMEFPGGVSAPSMHWRP